MLAFHDYYAHDLPPKMAPRQTIFPPYTSQTEGRELAPVFTRASVTAASIVALYCLEWGLLLAGVAFLRR